MAHVGVEGLGARGAEEHKAKDSQAGVVVGRGEEHQSAQRVKGAQHAGVLDEVHESSPAEEQEL